MEMEIFGLTGRGIRFKGKGDPDVVVGQRTGSLRLWHFCSWWSSGDGIIQSDHNLMG